MSWLQPMFATLPRSARRACGLVALAVAVAVVVAPAALAATPSVDIHSAGPLSDIYIGNDLSCQVRNGGFSSTEYFPNASGPGDCGTFLFVNGDGNAAFFGPDFANHAGGTNTTGHFSDTEVPYTPVSQSMTGSGTASNPYQVTTVTSGVDVNLTLTFTEVDTYVVGDNFFQTDFTVSNTSVSSGFSGELYHAADCQLRGSNNGFAAPEPSQASANTAACTPNPLGNPTSAREEFDPITSGNTWEEKTSATIWADLRQAFSGLSNQCDCSTFEDNGQAVEWPVSLSAGQTQTIQFETRIVDTVPTGGFSLSGTTAGTASGTVATISDPDTSATASAYAATINWGDGSSSAATITGGNGSFNVAGSHAYGTAGTYPVAVTVTAVGTNQGSSTVADTATITPSPASVITGAPPSVGGTTAAFTGSVVPDGLPTTAFFQYGLDPKYFGGGPVVYNQSTPAQAVGSDFTSHTVSASVTGLVPNALYHVRLVATNSAGTTFGPDVTFTTLKTPPPGAPTLGKTFNISLVSGIVLIKINGQFIPLTELRQIPANTVIDALHGTIELTTAVNGGSGARDVAAKAKKHIVKTQTGKFGGAIFKVTQARSGARKGQTTLSLVEGAFSGAPTYASCKAKKAADTLSPTAHAAVSSAVLQTLHSSAHGHFRTRGRYAAATVRGTIWTTTDRCDGTLTHAIKDTVSVQDFVRHIKVLVHQGHSYLAKAPTGRRK